MMRISLTERGVRVLSDKEDCQNRLVDWWHDVEPLDRIVFLRSYRHFRTHVSHAN